jgi:tryptophanyl-tRNA synthetase
MKCDEKVNALLDACEARLRGCGFTDLSKIPSYKALYLHSATEKDLPVLTELLLPVEREFGGYGFYPPAATYHKLMTGLKGGKMSSSSPESALFLSDELGEAAKKVMVCKTGGAVSIEAQRREGGKPEICSVYELLLYHFVEDDRELAAIYEACKAGERLCGYCKKFTAGLVEEFLRELYERRAAAKECIADYVVEC